MSNERRVPIGNSVESANPISITPEDFEALRSRGYALEGVPVNGVKNYRLYRSDGSQVFGVRADVVKVDGKLHTVFVQSSSVKLDVQKRT